MNNGRFCLFFPINDPKFLNHGQYSWLFSLEKSYPMLLKKEKRILSYITKISLIFIQERNHTFKLSSVAVRRYDDLKIVLDYILLCS